MILKCKRCGSPDMVVNIKKGWHSEHNGEYNGAYNDDKKEYIYDESVIEKHALRHIMGLADIVTCSEDSNANANNTES